MQQQSISSDAPIVPIMPIRKECPPGACVCQRELLIEDPSADKRILMLTQEQEKRLIERIGRVGETFDPNRMAVVEASVSSQPPGIVLLVNRSGYALDGAVKAVAQVTVSKPGI